jgi:DHA3 family tetracycline resistance protein-like MFS transporter
MSSQMDALGQIGGGPVVGAIGRTFSLRAALAVSGLILSPALWLYARSRRQPSAAA